MNIGIYVRPWSNDFYTLLASETFGKCNTVKFSEFKMSDVIWLGKALYNDNNQKEIFNNKEKIDIYLRCRFLRSKPIEESFLLISSMAQYISDLLDRFEIKYFIGSLIDNYTLDIIERICRKKKIQYASLVGHFFNGYCRITRRGELNKIRSNVSEIEIKNIINQVSNINYKPNFKLNKQRTIEEGKKYYYKRRLIDFIFSQIKYLKSDPLNYHYNTKSFTSGNIHNYISKKKFNNYFKSSINNIPPTSIYIPLHYTPESTVDYWVDSPIYALYEESIIDIIMKSSNDINFIIKEHPAMYMRRSLSFYQKLSQFENVLLIHPYYNSNSIIQKVNIVLVYTGSVGVEALLRKKNVLTITNNYYSSLHPNIRKVESSISHKYFDFKIVDYNNDTFISDILKGLIPGVFINNKNIMNSNISEISKYLKIYFEINTF